MTEWIININKYLSVYLLPTGRYFIIKINIRLLTIGLLSSVACKQQSTSLNR